MIFQTINQFGEEFSVNKFQMLKCVQVSEPERAVVTPSSTIYQYNILICLSSLTIGYNFLFMMTLTMEYVLNKRKSLENYFKYSCSFNDRYMSQALQILKSTPHTMSFGHITKGSPIGSSSLRSRSDRFRSSSTKIRICQHI